jgi:hypothetical protein
MGICQRSGDANTANARSDNEYVCFDCFGHAEPKSFR